MECNDGNYYGGYALLQGYVLSFLQNMATSHQEVHSCRSMKCKAITKLFHRLLNSWLKIWDHQDATTILTGNTIIKANKKDNLSNQGYRINILSHNWPYVHYYLSLIHGTILYKNHVLCYVCMTIFTGHNTLSIGITVVG